jgi:hypothetical protein
MSVIVILVGWPVTREQRLGSAQDLINGEQIVGRMTFEKVDGRSGHQWLCHGRSVGK